MAAEIDWFQILGWSTEEIEDLRFVGYSYIKQGHYQTAKVFFDAIVVLLPDSAYDLQTLGAIYLQLGNNLMALNYIEKALKIEPHHEPTLLNRIKALFGLGYKKQALLGAAQLKKSATPTVAGQAEALILAFS